MGTLSFAITVPNATANSASRAVKYVSPSTQSVAISLKGQTVPLATVNLSATSPGCAATPSGTACTVSASAPAGSDMFVITAFSGPNGTGQQLSTANVPATITASATTRVPLTLNGTVATVAVILGSSSVQVGSPASVAVTVVAYDAQNNVIVGPGNFSTPVTLADTDPSGATSLSTTTVAAPGTSVSLNYTGNSMTTATITPSIGSTTGTAATFTPSGSAFVNYVMPQPVDEIDALAPGPNGNLWFTAYGYFAGASIGYTTPQGATTTYTANLPQTTILGLAMLPNANNLWFGDDYGDIGTIASNGTVSYDTATFTEPCGTGYTDICGEVNAMIAGPDGNVWFTDDEGYIGVVVPTTGNVTEFDPTQLPGWPGGYSEPKHLAFFGGKLYVSDEDGYIDQFTISGGAATSVVQVPFVESCQACSPGAYALTIDTVGNVWFSDGCSDIGLVPATNFTQSAMLEWSIGSIDNNDSFAYMLATPGGIFATDNDDGNLYNIADVAGLSANQGPSITAVTAFSFSQADANVLAVGPDGNLWTATNDTSQQQPNVPPGLAKVIYSAPLGIVSIASARRATASFSHVRSGKLFPISRKHRKERRAAFALKYRRK
jgi:hypothetical protein